MGRLRNVPAITLISSLASRTIVQHVDGIPAARCGV
jgi:hypothetical protein